jgi:hypothetical protein
LEGNKTPNARAVLVALLMAGAIAAALWHPFVGAFIHRERNRSEVLALYHALAPGMTREQVSQITAGTAYPHLTIRRASAQLWSAEAPLEFGAGNWILWMEFEGEQLHAIRVRTADGLHDHPPEAPEDRVFARTDVNDAA